MAEIKETAEQRFRQLLKKYPGYDTNTYKLVYEALDYTLKNVVGSGNRPDHHVSAKELLEGLRLYAIEQFGCLAKTVLNENGIKRTNDVGEIVFNLIKENLMGKQESDMKEDFDNVYDFSQVFGVKPKFSYNPNKKEWKASYVQRRKKKGER